MTRHQDEDCRVPFCKKCLDRIKLVKKRADDIMITNQSYDDKELYYEAEYKLQNCLRITLNVESFITEVEATKDNWVPVTKYVLGLIEYIRQGGDT